MQFRSIAAVLVFASAFACGNRVTVERADSGSPSDDAGNPGDAGNPDDGGNLLGNGDGGDSGVPRDDAGNPILDGGDPLDAGPADAGDCLDSATADIPAGACISTLSCLQSHGYCPKFWEDLPPSACTGESTTCVCSCDSDLIYLGPGGHLVCVYDGASHVIKGIVYSGDTPSFCNHTVPGLQAGDIEWAEVTSCYSGPGTAGNVCAFTASDAGAADGG